MELGLQIAWLFLLALPIASISWTVTHEEVFREPRAYAEDRSQNARSLFVRKFFYLFTCEYCFSHYVTAFFLWLTRYKLLLDDWRGYLIAGFALVYLSNFYMALYARGKLGVKKDRFEIKDKQKTLEIKERALTPGNNKQEDSAA